MNRPSQKTVPELRLVFVLFLILLFWIPYPAGSNRPWSWSLLEMVSFGLMLVVVTSGWIRRGEWSGVRFEPRLPLLIGCIWLVYLALQTINLPPFLFQLLSSPATDAVSDLMINQYHHTSLSIDRYATWSEWFKNASYLCLFTLTAYLTTTSQRVRWLVLVMGLACLGEVSFGVYEVLSNARWGAAIDGTYVNHNHLAGLLELTVPLVLTFTLYEVKQRAATQSLYGGIIIKGALMALASLLELTVPLVLMFTHYEAKQRVVTQSVYGGIIAKGALMILAGLLFSGLFWAASRGGILATVVTCLLLGALLLRPWLKNRKQPIKTANVLIVVIPLVLIVLGTSGNVIERFDEGNTSTLNGRLYMLKLAPEMVTDSWRAGVGAGGLPHVLPWYYNESGPCCQFWHVHNDYIELFVDQGIVGFSLVAFLVLYVLYRNCRALKYTPSSFERHMLTGTLFSQVIFLIHGMSDFNFYIPSNAAYYFVIMGLVFALEAMGRSGALSQPPVSGSENSG